MCKTMKQTIEVRYGIWGKCQG